MTLSLNTKTDEATLSALRALKKEGIDVQITTTQNERDQTKRMAIVTWTTHNPSAKVL